MRCWRQILSLGGMAAALMAGCAERKADAPLEVEAQLDLQSSAAPRATTAPTLAHELTHVEQQKAPRARVGENQTETVGGNQTLSVGGAK